MLWLYRLGAAVQRVVLRQAPPTDELYSHQISLDRLQSGVAWVGADGRLGAVNSSLAATLSADPKSLVGSDWLEIFAEHERDRASESANRMLLLGVTEFNAYGLRADGTFAWLKVTLVAVHDYKMRFVGHHCLVLDSTHNRILEDRVKELERDAISASR